MTKRMMALTAALGMAAGMGSGCAVLDGLTASMVRAGILMPSSPRVSGIEAEAVVEVRAGGARGTGVAVEGGYILTAAHVVSGRATASIYRHSLIPGAPAARESATVVWRDPGTDTALLSPQSRNERGTSGAPREGEAWLVTLSVNGRSLSGRTRGPRLRAARILPNKRFSVDGGVRPGDSGSPLLQRGRVVGVVRSADRYASAAPVAVAVMRAQRSEAAGGEAVVVARLQG